MRGRGSITTGRGEAVPDSPTAGRRVPSTTGWKVGRAMSLPLEADRQSGRVSGRSLPIHNPTPTPLLCVAPGATLGPFRFCRQKAATWINTETPACGLDWFLAPCPAVCPSEFLRRDETTHRTGR